MAYQTMYDYLDAVNEQPGATPIDNGQQLHSALLPHTLAEMTASDFYSYNPMAGDADYLQTLAHTWQASLSTLPSAMVVQDALAVAARRCSEAQAHNHAIADEKHHLLADWAQQQSQRSEYLWWELAAAGISCLAIHALLAAAATPQTTAQGAHQINEAYFPDVCAISALLDSLVDYPDDIQTANHSFIAHYDSHAEVAARHTAIIRDARARLQGLSKSSRHNLILTGVVAYYLSAAETDSSRAVALLNQAISRDAITRTVIAAMRVRRRHHSRDVI